MTNQNLRLVSDHDPDLDFAGRAVVYLENQGLNEEEIVKCLIEELYLDRETAQAVVSLAA